MPRAAGVAPRGRRVRWIMSRPVLAFTLPLLAVVAACDDGASLEGTWRQIPYAYQVGDPIEERTVVTFDADGTYTVVEEAGIETGTWEGPVGLRHVVSLGEKIDVADAELVRWLAKDQDTATIGFYLESLDDARAFHEAVRAAAPYKSIVVLRGGTTGAGHRAAKAHEATTSVSDRALEGRDEPHRTGSPDDPWHVRAGTTRVSSTRVADGAALPAVFPRAVGIEPG